MRKILLVAEFEFLQTAKRWQFLLITLGLPIFIVLLGGASVYSGGYAKKSFQKTLKEGKKILIEDRSGLLLKKLPPPFQKVSSIKENLNLINSGKSPGGLIISKDWLKTSKVQLVVPKNKALGASKTFLKPLETMIRSFLLKEIKNEDKRKRIFNTAQISLNIIKNKTEIAPFDYHQLIIPFLFLIIFILSTSTASTFLLQSVSEEKENRTIELLLSTLSDQELITGKVIGLGSAALVQVIIWSIMGVSSIGVISKKYNLPIEASKIPLSHILFSSLVLILGFLLFTAIMVGVGSLAANYKDAQQLSSFFMISSFLPVYVIQVIINDIHGSLAKFLYYFPLTSPIVITTRFCLGNLSIAESAAGIFVLGFFTIFSIFLSAKLFKLGCLIFNRRPSMKELKKVWMTN